MKYAVYILSALLALTAVVLVVVTGFFAIPPGYPMALLLGVQVIFALLQLKTPTPRLLLLVCGTSVSYSLSFFTAMPLPALVGIAAGLLPAVYGLVLYARLVKAEPVKPDGSRALTAAAVIACAYPIWNIVRALMGFAGAGAWLNAALWGGVGLAVFSLLKNRRTSVLYRMFFVGLIRGAIPVQQGEGMLSQIIGWISVCLLVFALMIVLVEAVRSRGVLEKAVGLPKPRDSHYTAYVISAVLSLLMVLVFLKTAEPPYLIILPGAYGLLVCIQLFKHTPRLVLLLSGAALMLTQRAMLGGTPVAFFLLAAVLLPVVYELIRCSREVKASPGKLQKSGLLMAAGFLSVLYALLLIFITAQKVNDPMFFTDELVGVVMAAGLGVACFAKVRRVSAHWRMLFSGALLCGALLATRAILYYLAGGYYSLITYRLADAVSLAAAVLALIHAAKHRREDTVPTVPETESKAQTVE